MTHFGLLLMSVTVEFSSQAIPQPFLDPNILKSRFQANQQWKLEQERNASDEAPISSSSRAS